MSPGQRGGNPPLAGVEQAQGQDVLAGTLAEPVLLEEVAGAAGLGDPLVGEDRALTFRLLSDPGGRIERRPATAAGTR